LGQYVLIVRAILIALVLVLTCSAQADDRKKAARLRFDRANKEYNLQQWDVALKDFQELYLELSDPVLLFNIGQCQRQLGDFGAAAKSFRAYLAQAPKVQNEEQVVRLIAQMEDAQRAKDAQAAPAPAQPEPAAVPAPAPTPVATVAAAPPRRLKYKVPAAVCLAIGGVALITGGALVGIATSQGNSADRATTQMDFDRYHDADVRFQKGGWPLLGIGAAGVAAGVIVLAVDLSRARR
jgi:tetratricopeptide (TPR) repeat protein